MAGRIRAGLVEQNRSARLKRYAYSRIVPSNTAGVHRGETILRFTVHAGGAIIIREGHGTGEGRGTSPGEVHDSRPIRITCASLSPEHWSLKSAMSSLSATNFHQSARLVRLTRLLASTNSASRVARGRGPRNRSGMARAAAGNAVRLRRPCVWK